MANDNSARCSKRFTVCRIIAGHADRRQVVIQDANPRIGERQVQKPYTRINAQSLLLNRSCQITEQRVQLLHIKRVMYTNRTDTAFIPIVILVDVIGQYCRNA